MGTRLRQAWQLIWRSIVMASLRPFWVWVGGGVWRWVGGSGAVVSGLFWLISFAQHLDRSWVIGSVIGFCFCLFITLLSATLHAVQQRHLRSEATGLVGSLGTYGEIRRLLDSLRNKPPANAADYQMYSALLTAQATIEQAVARFRSDPTAKVALNKAISSFNTALKSYKAYHDGVSGGAAQDPSSIHSQVNAAVSAAAEIEGLAVAAAAAKTTGAPNPVAPAPNPAALSRAVPSASNALQHNGAPEPTLEVTIIADTDVSFVHLQDVWLSDDAAAKATGTTLAGHLTAEITNHDSLETEIQHMALVLLAANELDELEPSATPENIISRLGESAANRIVPARRSAKFELDHRAVFAIAKEATSIDLVRLSVRATGTRTAVKVCIPRDILNRGRAIRRAPETENTEHLRVRALLKDLSAEQWRILAQLAREGPTSLILGPDIFILSDARLIQSLGSGLGPIPGINQVWRIHPEARDAVIDAIGHERHLRS